MGPELNPLDFHIRAAAQTRAYKENQIPLSLSYNVSKPSLKDIARRRSKTFARIS
ncbi:Hypothetical protein FKW44_013114 [Caligus rogercresseyi]|uniref:Uncharacterized protein n=1 Tax=Caligus rogercresseyi TaxID=217165 RepID=A0A7T8HKM4_CALRO|nr:Hypothetical protein FKW44_013114 [Caligus rogercresseyi]